MSPGPAEEVGQTARSVVEALKSQPLAIALVVVNCMFLVGGGWFMHSLLTTSEERNVRASKLVEQILESQQHAQELLFKCVPSDGKTSIPLPIPRPSELGPPHITDDPI